MIMSPELELFVQEEVASGRFPDREAFISYCVRVLKLDRDDAVKGIQLGLDEADAGLSCLANFGQCSGYRGLVSWVEW
jgi:Arc/MetJ-type ribon-helix-helix transcriptional regulator